VNTTDKFGEVQGTTGMHHEGACMLQIYRAVGGLKSTLQNPNFTLIV